MDFNTTVVIPQVTTLCKKSRRGKKSVSNDNMKTRLFVERNAVSSVLDSKDVTTIHNKRKAPLRPRPGQKKFMSSVLTILSKSTASTQYPDIDDINNKKPKPRRHKALKSGENTKNIYKSKILNQLPLEDDFIILQSQRDMNQSSSIYSESVNLVRSDVQQSREENSILNQVLEGKKCGREEPRMSAETGENDKKVYNLFVDLLETTINMYNAGTERDNNKNLNTILEINQDVAEKLDISTKYNESRHSLVKEKLSELGMYRETGANIVDNAIPTKFSHHIFPKIKAKSFVHVKKAINLPKSKSFEPKTSAIKSRKKNLLNILKEQIKMGVTVEEPRNLYEALKIMAKNKQRSEKSIKFYHPERIVESGRRDPECVFKRRNLFTKPKKRCKIDKVVQRNTNFDKTTVKTDNNKIRIVKSIPSYRSVEVYGYNYEERDVNKDFKEQNERRRMREDIENRRVMFTYHPPSPLISDLDYCALLKYPDTSASYCAIQQYGNYEIQ